MNRCEFLKGNSGFNFMIFIFENAGNLKKNTCTARIRIKKDAKLTKLHAFEGF